MNLGPLYHWAPTRCRNSIARHGLRIRQPATVAAAPLDWVCLGFDPRSAWTISGATAQLTDITEWDLWQVTLGDSDSLHVRPEFGASLHEVQVRNDIPADRVWLVAIRQV